MSALMKSPTSSALPLTVTTIAEKSGLPAIAAMSGMTRSFTSAATTAPNAPPITTATARSRTLPRRRNCRKPLNIWDPARSALARRQIVDEAADAAGRRADARAFLATRERADRGARARAAADDQRFLLPRPLVRV